MPTSIRPIGQHVLIRQAKAPTVSAGGIVIPDSAQKEGNKGLVVAVGPGRVTNMGALVPTTVQPGDVVWWSKYQGTEFESDGQKFWLVREDDINGYARPEGE